MQPNVQPVAANTYIPDSLDALALNGIVPYDVKAFIYDKKSELPLPNTKNNLQNDKFDPNNPNPEANNNNKTQTQKSGNGWKTFGAAFLTTCALAIGAVILKKKMPDKIKLPKAVKEINVKEGLDKTGSKIRELATKCFEGLKEIFGKSKTK